MLQTYRSPNAHGCGARAASHAAAGLVAKSKARQGVLVVFPRSICNQPPQRPQFLRPDSGRFGEHDVALRLVLDPAPDLVLDPAPDSEQLHTAGANREIDVEFSCIEHASALAAREPQVPLDGLSLSWKMLAGAGSAPWLEQLPLYRRQLVDRDHAQWLSLLALHDR
jgi:hypothetical protein